MNHTSKCNMQNYKTSRRKHWKNFSCAKVRDFRYDTKGMIHKDKN